MSTETLAIVISGATLLLSFFAAFGWMIHRTDTRLDRLGEHISGVERRLGEHITGVERELGEVKIAIARIEGPSRHLLPLR